MPVRKQLHLYQRLGRTPASTLPHLKPDEKGHAVKCGQMGQSQIQAPPTLLVNSWANVIVDGMAAWALLDELRRPPKTKQVVFTPLP